MLSRFVCSFLMLMLVCHATFADETDQFTLPERETFTDIGPYVDLLHYRVLERVVADMNERIDEALRITNHRRREAILERLHAPERLADRARHYFGQGFVSVRLLEDALFGSSGREAYPDQLIAYKTSDWIYSSTHLPLDPRTLVLNFKGPTVYVHGTHFGIDKFGHAFDLGHLYYKSYRRGIAEGLSEEDAMRRTVTIFSRGPISEVGIIGIFATGVISNADLAANYTGMKWYLNMTEPVMLKGEEHPPMLVRVGDYWAINEHVRPDVPFMAPFYSDHLNEALNPNTYEWAMRQQIARHLRERADDILAFYVDEDGQQRTQACFEALYDELSTYYGEDYGHWGVDPVATIANACFPCDDRKEQRALRKKWIDPAHTSYVAGFGR